MTTQAIEDVYDLTPLQHGLLIHCLREPSAGYYVEQMYFTFTGDLRADIVRNAWTRIIERHPALRTAFSWDDINRPVQVIARTATLPLDEVDLRAIAEPEERERAFGERLLAERSRGFDLESPPLLELTVFRMDDETYRMAWRFSHLIMDGWSFGLIMGDFVTLYKALYHGRRPTLGPGRSPRDYVRWWRSRDTAALVSFWADQFAGYEPPTRLDLGDDSTQDRPSPADPVRHGYVQSSLGDLVPGLTALAREDRLTMNTLVQGAWALVLSRCLGTDDVVVGATMSHRPDEVEGVESMVGPLIVTLPVRTTIDPTAPVRDWLHGVQERVLAVRDHAEVPLPDIRRASGLGDLADLFETIVSYENVPIPDVDFDDEGMALAGWEVDGRPQYPISLIALPGDDLPLRVIYDRDRFSRDGADRMLRRLRATLAAIVADPGAPTGEIDVVDDRERADVLALTRPGPAPAGDRSLVATVREYAAARSDAVAVTDAHGALTYGGLVARADAVAAALVDAGVGAGDRVAVATERGGELVVAVLGALAAGAAYVPLDPADPPGRHRLVLGDCAPAAVLTDGPTREAVTTALGGLNTAAPPVLEVGAAPEGAPAPNREARGDDVAYVLYTSGTTGTPKGVEVTHDNVAHLAAGGQAEFGLGPDDVVSMFFSPAFDGAAWELWAALCHGARLVIASREVARSPEDFHALLVRERVTVTTVSPSAFHQLAAVASGDTSLRLLVLGGEKVDAAAVRPWFDVHGDATLVVNAYGPTEATVWICHHPMSAAESREPAQRALIGRPMPGSAVAVVGANGRPAPWGAPGEMYLCGPGVAAGYLGRPELTAARFGPEPFPAPGTTPARCYASGDRGRLTARGELEFLGRVDEQVKIRGFRVEPGEVADRLRRHEAVDEAVVAARGGGSAGTELVAWVVPADVAGVPGADPAALAETLRAHCAEVLPAHMVPAAVLAVERIPLKANGKPDLAALPDAALARGGDPAVAPRTPTEARFAEVVAGLLELGEVGVTDDLQQLGLHSLVATRVVAEIRRNWRVDVPLRTLFEGPTVETVAAILDAGGVQRTGRDRPGAPDFERETELPADITPDVPARSGGAPRTVVVTGATGFPGARLVADLLAAGDEVHALVRADGDDAARERLVAHLDALGWWDPVRADGLHVHAADLSQPYLALSPERFTELAGRTDAIFHFGAQVNFLHSYRRLRSTNVRGTEEILRLAATGPVSTVHHVSGVGVVPPGGEVDGVRGIEADLAPDAPDLPNGYTETKWVAERLVTTARDRGLPVVVHRLGRVSGDSASGAWSASGDALAELLRAADVLGRLPEFEGGLDMVPVDHVTAAMDALARTPEALGSVFHLVNPRPVTLADLVEGFRRAGREVGTEPVAAWRRRLQARVAEHPDEDWSVVTTLLTEWSARSGDRMRDPRFASERLERVLGDRVSCPPVDGAVIARYLGFLAGSGFLADRDETPDDIRDESGEQQWSLTRTAS